MRGVGEAAGSVKSVGEGAGGAEEARGTRPDEKRRGQQLESLERLSTRRSRSKKQRGLLLRPRHGRLYEKNYLLVPCIALSSQAEAQQKEIQRRQKELEELEVGDAKGDKKSSQSMKNNEKPTFHDKVSSFRPHATIYVQERLRRHEAKRFRAWQEQRFTSELQKWAEKQQEDGNAKGYRSMLTCGFGAAVACEATSVI